MITGQQIICTTKQSIERVLETLCEDVISEQKIFHSQEVEADECVRIEKKQGTLTCRVLHSPFCNLRENVIQHIGFKCYLKSKKIYQKQQPRAHYSLSRSLKLLAVKKVAIYELELGVSVYIMMNPAH
ncbi:MAG: hypothetical protein EZS28_027714 [Streblomastix strix]|uniref:Uncharacterized protein n=1 Tax=Streblomastix strix TaxID=222440 RepID=A0A5J4V1Z9_9EUKA|nr:MAG: hypothetical protein EZS28_027714 [Streblomastix strix]